MWITRSIAPAPPTPALLSNHRLPVTTMLWCSLFARERRAFGLGLETVPLQYFTERNVAHLVGEFRDSHLLIGHPMERRTSSKGALTSSGEGQSDNVAGSPNFSSLEALCFGGGSSGVKPSLVWCSTSSA